MADFARWVSAAEAALGLDTGSFVAAYGENRAGAVQLTLESSPLSAPVIEIAAGGFEGSASALLDRLNNLVTDDVRRQREWPKRAHTLSGRLRRLAPALRRVDVFVEFSRDSRNRTVAISTRPQNSVTSVTDRHSADAVTQRDADDAVSQTSTNRLPIGDGR